MDGISEILSRMKDFTRAHAVDVENELLSYDFKKNGVISTVSLHRWIASIGINLSNRAIQTLILAYQTNGGIDVRALINAICKSNSFNETISSRPPTCTTELSDLARELARRRQNIREALVPFDRMNSGHVNVNNFYRAFGSNPTTKAVADYYAQGDSIDYLRIGNDLKNVSRNIDTTQYTIPEPTPAFAQLATFIKSREIDARLVFSQTDRLNTGKLPRRQFHSVLSSFGAMISPSGLMEIADNFAEAGDMCNYNIFLMALERFVPPPPRAASRSIDVPEELSKAEDPHNLVESARGNIAVRRIDVDVHFAPAQRECPGQDEISLNLFDRLLMGMRIDLSHEEIESIAKLYRGPSGGVLYKKFVDAVRLPDMTREITTNDVLPRLKEHLLTTRQKLAPSAARFDREGSGSISVQQFVSALQFVRFDFNNQEIAAIRDAFPGSQRGTIAWETFCMQVDPQITQRGSPGFDAATAEIAAQETREAQYNPPPNNVSNVISKIAKGARHNNIDVFSEFRSKDSMRRGLISQQSFTNFIYSLPIQLNPVELRTIVSYYRVSGSSDINYISISTDIKKTVDAEETAQLEMTRSHAMEAKIEQVPEMPATVHSFIQRYKTYAEQMRISTTDVFRPYDVNNNGTVPIYKVQACFNNFNFQTLRNEVEQLVDVFRDKRKAELFNYHTFIKAVEEEDITSPDVRASLSSAPISSEIERNAQTSCSQIREKLLARHRRIDIAFIGISTPTISTAEFQTRLNSFDIVLTASQVQSLLRKYRMNLSDQINYKQFIDDVNNSKTI